MKKIIYVKRYTNFYDYTDVLRYHIVEMIVDTQTFMIKKSVLDYIGI